MRFFCFTIATQQIKISSNKGHQSKALVFLSTIAAKLKLFSCQRSTFSFRLNAKVP